MAHTFAVDPVPLDVDPLEPSADTALRERGVRDALAVDAPACVQSIPLNGFLMAAHLAYTRHRPLTLSPDAVWLAIAQGIARHVEVNAEALRPRLVRHADKLTLTVRRDELGREPRNAALWGGVVDEIAAQVREHIGGRADLFVNAFSTTETRARVASQIVLLSGMQQYFDYVVETLCGIPRVTILGTPADWADIQRRVRVLDELDLASWRAVLEPVVAECARAAAGAPDVAQWRNLYKVVSASGGEEVSGFVNAFFPYLGDHGARKNPQAWSETKNDDPRMRELPRLGDFPPGLASAPFTWRFLTGDRAMQLIAGFVGVGTHDDAVCPAIGWAVAPAQARRVFRSVGDYDDVSWLAARDPYEVTSLSELAAEIAIEGFTRVGLRLSYTPVTTIEELTALPMIEAVHLYGLPTLADLEPLTRMRGLRSIQIGHCNAIVDYTPLARIPNATHIELHGSTAPFSGDFKGASRIAELRSLLLRR